MKLRAIAENIWVAQYPLRLLGVPIGRNVTIVRLRDGRLIIHSTAPFTAEDLLKIRALGEPAWLLDATLFHDSFAREGCRALEGVPYFAPPGFRKIDGVTILSLDPPPADWAGELEMRRVEGMPKVCEHVFFHCASRTLIVCDLLFHFPADLGGWPRFFVRHVMRLPRLIGMSLFLRLMVKDREAFSASLREIMKWDFERIIVGHGEPISRDARGVWRGAMCDRGFDV